MALRTARTRIERARAVDVRSPRVEVGRRRCAPGAALAIVGSKARRVPQHHPRQGGREPARIRGLPPRLELDYWFTTTFSVTVAEYRPPPWVLAFEMSARTNSLRSPPPM